MTGENFETTTVEEVSTVEVCDSCGTDLSDVEPCAREQRVLRDIKFTVVDLKVDAEIKDCPECRARTKGRFPENMPGPLQYGNGIKAFMINLLATQMVSLNRAVIRLEMNQEEKKSFYLHFIHTFLLACVCYLFRTT